jgi:DNA polymerase III delta subunit
MNNKKLKQQICDALDERKTKEKAIMSIFFPTDNRKIKQKHKRIYKMLKTNLKKMDNDRLNLLCGNLEKNI